VEEVASLLLRKLSRGTAERGETVADTLAVRSAFLRHRFTDRVAAYEKGDRLFGRLDTLLNLASVAAGIGASLLAAKGSSKGWTIALGVAIAGCQTISQWLKPAQRAAHRGRAASELRNQAWDILQGHDRYRGKNLDQAWDIFCSQVDKVENREEIMEDGDSSSRFEPTSAPAANGVGPPHPMG
jgi:hypothetical protein